MFCDSMDVAKSQRVPFQFFRHCDTMFSKKIPRRVPLHFFDVLLQWILKNPRWSPFLAGQGPALTGPRRVDSVHLLGFPGTVKNTFHFEVLLLFFEPYIWRRLMPFPACSIILRDLRNYSIPNSLSFFITVPCFLKKNSS